MASRMVERRRDDRCWLETYRTLAFRSVEIDLLDYNIPVHRPGI
ncbi:MAG: hypothetical protein OXC14_02395 [Rhodospirillaceae bacterium]|nr:hypothetical protein [Rhodospirillaceae bacterium]